MTNKLRTEQSAFAKWMAIGVCIFTFIGAIVASEAFHLSQNIVLIFFLISLVSGIWLTFFCIEDSYIYYIFNKKQSTKFIASAVFAIFLWSARTESASLLNEIFYTDASLFPYTHAFLTIAIFAAYSIYIQVPLIIFHIWNAFTNYRSNSENSLRDLAASIVIAAVLLITAITVWINFHSDKIKTITWRIAQQADFMEKHRCFDIMSKKVVYIGPEQNKVLSVEKTSIPYLLNKRTSEEYKAMDIKNINSEQCK